MARPKPPAWLTTAFAEGVVDLMPQRPAPAYKGALGRCWLAQHDERRRPCEGRRKAYDDWFHICHCGHGVDTHGQGGPCDAKGCDCRGYDHITGKPDHPLNHLPEDDSRRKAIEAQTLDRVREALRERITSLRNCVDYPPETERHKGLSEGYDHAATALEKLLSTLDSVVKGGEGGG